MNLSEVHYTM